MGDENGTNNQERDIASKVLMEQKARAYQLELFEFAKKNNTIVCLGTGTGKTFISVLLIKHFEHEVAGPWNGGQNSPGGKRTIFLAPTVPLVEQQKNVLEKHMTVKVKSYVGAINTDWTEEYWNRELEKVGILVLTPAFFLQIRPFIPLDRINLIVFDECHRATGGDPYVQIMQTYKSVAVEKRPRVLGLTASAVTAKVSGIEVSKKIRDLESTFYSVARTATQNAVQFGTKPQEIIVAFKRLSSSELPDYAELMKSLKDAADYKEFEKSLRILKEIYDTCGKFCLKKLLDFRRKELKAALAAPDCTEEFKNNAETKRAIYETMEKFVGEDPSPRDVQPKLEKLLYILESCGKSNNKSPLCGLVFVQRRLVAYVLYEWMREISKSDDYDFVRCAFIVGQGQSSVYGGGSDNTDGFKMNARAQNRVMKDFRENTYNLLFATSVIEEGMDVPVCNLVIRFDLPDDVRSYTQSKGRARAKPSLYLMLVEEKEEAKTKDLVSLFQETETTVMRCCELERAGPTDQESELVLKEDPDLPSYVNGNASITAQSAVSLLNWYAQTNMKEKYSNAFPEYEVKQLENKSFVCTLSMPITCPIRDPVTSDKAFESSMKARIAVAMKLLKQLHGCGELNDHLIPRIKTDSVHKLKLSEEDLELDERLNELLVPKRNKRNAQKRCIFPRKQADCLTTEIENLDYDEQDFYHLYVLKTEIHKWANSERKWNGEDLFDPSEHPINPALILKDEIPDSETLPKFPIYTRSGEELVDIVYAGRISITDAMRDTCSRFNRYVFMIVLQIWDNTMIPSHSFATPTVVLTEPDGEGGYKLCMEIMEDIHAPHIASTPFEFNKEIYEDSVVELLYHINENLPRYCEKTHTDQPASKYRRFYVTSVEASNEDGTLLTPHTQGVFKFSKELSLADYLYEKEIRGREFEEVQEQPVMRVEPAQDRLDMTRARSYKEGEVDPELIMTKDDIKTDQGPTNINYALPQFVAVHFLKPAVWRKLLCIPSILHRLNRILVAEELRATIAKETGLGKLVNPERWETMTIVPFKIEPPPTLSDSDDYPEPVEPKEALSADRAFDRSSLELKLLNQPDSKGQLGPSPCDILKALTAKSTNDFRDSERFQLLGKSFLRLVSTMSLYDNHPKATVGELLALQQYRIQSKNLLRKALKRNLTSSIETTVFKARMNFLPPGFKSIPLEEHLLDPDVLRIIFEYFGYDGMSEPKLKDIRYARALIQILQTAATFDEEEFDFEVGESRLEDDEIPQRAAIPVKTFQNYKAKAAANIIESLIGLYLEKCGSIGAYKFLKWIDLDHGELKTENFVEIYKLDFEETKSIPDSALRVYDHLIDRVQEKLEYKFKHRSLVLEAISHHSCREHSLTRDNAKLAFIGAAVLDFLFSNYLHKMTRELTPGQLSDLHAVLTDAQVAAHAIVKNELHTCLLYTNNNLFRTIRKYLDNIDEIALNLNTVLGDWEVDDGEEAEIPAPIASLMSSLIGAVFVDSDRDLLEVWRVIVNVMGYEISVLSKDIPITPIQELMRDYPYSFFSRPVPVDEGDNKNKFSITLNVGLFTLSHVAESKKAGKLILAKRFLRRRQREARTEEITQNRDVVEENVGSLIDALLKSEVADSKYYRKKTAQRAP